jgi:hypothetical protein
MHTKTFRPYDQDRFHLMLPSVRDLVDPEMEASTDTDRWS